MVAQSPNSTNTNVNVFVDRMRAAAQKMIEAFEEAHAVRIEFDALGGQAFTNAAFLDGDGVAILKQYDAGDVYNAVVSLKVLALDDTGSPSHDTLAGYLPALYRML